MEAPATRIDTQAKTPEELVRVWRETAARGREAEQVAVAQGLQESTAHAMMTTVIEMCAAELEEVLYRAARGEG